MFVSLTMSMGVCWPCWAAAALPPSAALAAVAVLPGTPGGVTTAPVPSVVAGVMAGSEAVGAATAAGR